MISAINKSSIVWQEVFDDASKVRSIKTAFGFDNMRDLILPWMEGTLMKLPCNAGETSLPFHLSCNTETNDNGIDLISSIYLILQRRLLLVSPSPLLPRHLIFNRKLKYSEDRSFFQKGRTNINKSLLLLREF